MKTLELTRQQIANDYGNGVTNLYTLGAKYGVSDRTARSIVRAFGYPPQNGSQPNFSNADEIAEKYLEGTPKRQLVNLYNVALKTIDIILASKGIDQRSSFDCRKKYDFNERIFASEVNEAIAYWLGFLMADGYIYVNKTKPEYRLVLNLQYSDIETLEAFKTFMGATHPIKKITRPDGREGCTIQFHSKNLIDDLAVFGVVPRKTFDMAFSNIPNDLRHHFIRGYFDGDGGWNIVHSKDGYDRCKFGFTCGDKKFLERLKNVLISECGLGDIKILQAKNSKAYQLYWGGRTQAKRFFDYLYQDATVFMGRKKNKGFECSSS